MPLLTNVIVTTARPTYNATTKITGPATTYLTGIEMHLEPDKEANFLAQSEGALDVHYTGHVDSGVDVAVGDTLTSIKLASDGVTDYPGASDGPATGSGNVEWRVTFHEETAPALLPERKLHITRVRGGGPR